MRAQLAAREHAPIQRPVHLLYAYSSVSTRSGRAHEHTYITIDRSIHTNKIIFHVGLDAKAGPMDKIGGTRETSLRQLERAETGTVQVLLVASSKKVVLVRLYEVSYPGDRVCSRKLILFVKL
jgi:hypothetical protein